MARKGDDFRIRPGKVRDQGGGRTSARRIGRIRRRPTSFLGEVHLAIRRAGGNPDRPGGAGKGNGRFNARGRGAATALTLTLKDRSAWSRDGSGARTRARRVDVKARVVKLNPQRGALRGRQFVSAKAVDAHRHRARSLRHSLFAIAPLIPTANFAIANWGDACVWIGGLIGILNSAGCRSFAKRR